MPAKKPRTKAETAAAAMIFAYDSVLPVDKFVLAVDVGATEDGSELAVSLDVH